MQLRCNQRGKDEIYGLNGRLGGDSIERKDGNYPHIYYSSPSHTLRSQTTVLFIDLLYVCKEVLVTGFIREYSESCRLSGVDKICFRCNLGANSVETMETMDKTGSFSPKSRTE